MPGARSPARLPFVSLSVILSLFSAPRRDRRDGLRVVAVVVLVLLVLVRVLLGVVVDVLPVPTFPVRGGRQLAPAPRAGHAARAGAAAAPLVRR